MAIVVSVLIGVPGSIYSEELLGLMGASERVIAEGAGYTKIMFSTNAVIIFLFVLNGVFRGAGEAAIAMRVLILSNGINILLDPLFIFGWGPIPGYGVAGAAVATSIGRGLGVIYQLYILFGGHSTVKLGRSEALIDGAMLWRIWKIASSGALQYLVGSASWVALMRIIATFGTAAVAGYTVAVRLVLFTLLPAWGLSNAAATFVGQNLGAKRPDRAEAGVKAALWMTTGYLGAVAIVYYLGAGPLVRGFIAEGESVGVGIQTLQIFALGYILFGTGMILLQAFNGAGDTRTPTLVNFVCFWIIEIPLGYWFALELGYEVAGVVWAILVAEVLLTVVGAWLFLRGRWKEVEV